MNLKTAKAIRRYLRAIGKDWRDAKYEQHRKDTIALTSQCGKGLYRYFKKAP